MKLIEIYKIIVCVDKDIMKTKIISVKNVIFNAKPVKIIVFNVKSVQISQEIFN